MKQAVEIYLSRMRTAGAETCLGKSRASQSVQNEPTHWTWQDNPRSSSSQVSVSWPMIFWLTDGIHVPLHHHSAPCLCWDNLCKRLRLVSCDRKFGYNLMRNSDWSANNSQPCKITPSMYEAIAAILLYWKHVNVEVLGFSNCGFCMAW